MAGVFDMNKSQQELQEQSSGKGRGFFQSLIGDKFKNIGRKIDNTRYDIQGEGSNFQKEIGLVSQRFKKEMMVLASRTLDSLQAQTQMHAMEGNKYNALKQINSGEITDLRALKEGLSNMDPALRKAVLNKPNLRAKSYTGIERASINNFVVEKTKRLDYNKAISADLTKNINENIKSGMSKDDAINKAYQSTSEKFGFEDLKFKEGESNEFSKSMISNIKNNLGDRELDGHLSERKLDKAFEKSFDESIKAMEVDGDLAKKAFRANVSEKVALDVVNETKNAHKIALDKNLVLKDGKAVDVGIKKASESLGLSEKDVSKVLDSYKDAQKRFNIKDKKTPLLGIPLNNMRKGFMYGDLKSSMDIDSKKESITGEKTNYKNRDIYGVNLSDKTVKQKKLDIKQYEKMAKAEQKLMEQAVGKNGKNIAELSNENKER